MSEIGTLCKSTKPAELGALAPGCQAKIMDDNGQVLGPKQTGEILGKTPRIMNGKFDSGCIELTGTINYVYYSVFDLRLN